MRILRKLFLLTLLQLSFASIVFGNSSDSFSSFLQKEATTLITRHASEIRRIAQKIRKNYPPENYIYVSIGRSPTPITTYLKVIGSEVLPLPLSNLSEKEEDTVLNYESLAEHFTRFLPSNSGKKILFIDYSTRGRTIIFFEEILKELKARGLFELAAEFEFFLMVDQIDYDVFIKPLLTDNLESPFTVYPVSRKPEHIGVSLRRQYFDNFSSHHRYDALDHDPIFPYENPQHSVLLHVYNEVFKVDIQNSRQFSCKRILNL